MLSNFNFTHKEYLHNNMLFKLIVIEDGRCLVKQFYEASPDSEKIGWELITDDYIEVTEADYLVQQRIKDEK